MYKKIRDKMIKIWKCRKMLYKKNEFSGHNQFVYTRVELLGFGRYYQHFEVELRSIQFTYTINHRYEFCINDEKNIK